MTLFLRQRNEALDEDQKTLREQLGLYKKQVEIWEKAAGEEQGPGLEMLDSADYFKYKILISNFSEAINQILQNFGKQDFAGIGGLQKAYEALARFARNVNQGPYLTADKERVFNMLIPAIGALKKIEALAAEDAFSATEKMVVGNILGNILAKNFEPLGFLDAPSQTERETELEKRQQRSKRGEPIEKKKDAIDTTDERFKDLKKKLDAVVKATRGEIINENLKAEKFRLKNNSGTGKISLRMFNEISNAYNRLVPPTLLPPPKAAAASGIVDSESAEFDGLRRDLTYLLFRPEMERDAARLIENLDDKAAAGSVSRRAFNKIKKSYQDLLKPENPLFSPPFLRQRQPQLQPDEDIEEF